MKDNLYLHEQAITTDHNYWSYVESHIFVSICQHEALLIYINEGLIVYGRRMFHFLLICKVK